MRPRISWADLRGARVGVWGAGVEGTAAVRLLRTMEVTPLVVDDRPAADTVEGVPVVSTSQWALDELAACDFVVKAPGISPYRDDVRDVARRGATLVGGLGMWLEGVDRSRVVCVTGTKGKSTTVSIAGALATGLGADCFVGGNIGRPPFDPTAPSDADCWVIEVSSYQAHDLTCAPPVVGVTSLNADHLDWHGDVETYFLDKLSMCRLPGAQRTIANGDDELVVARRAQLGPDVEWVHAIDDPPDWIVRLGLPGRHNVRNALIAQRCLVALGVPGADDTSALAAAADGFGGLDSRLQTIGSVDGVRFVDDSLSTNVLSTVAALDAYAGERIALLVGGFDRGIDYAPLAAHLAGWPTPLLVLTLPDSGDRIGRELEAVSLPAHVEVRPQTELPEAVVQAFAWCGHDGVVLLSPAAPSFGRYRDYHDRSEVFRKAMATVRPM